MFKLGIMTMVVFTILLLSIKAVFIGKALLIINLGFILAKVLAWKSKGEFGHGSHFEPNQWSPQYGGGKQNNDIHVHIHNPAPVSYSSDHHQPYSGYAQKTYGPNIHIEPGSYGSYGSYGGAEVAGGYATIKRQ